MIPNVKNWNVLGNSCRLLRGNLILHSRITGKVEREKEKKKKTKKRINKSTIQFSISSTICTLPNICKLQNPN